MNSPAFQSLSESKWPKCLSGILLMLLLLPFSSFSQQARKEVKLRHRLSAGPVISMFKNDPHFSVNTKKKAGANVAYKAEYPISRRTNLMAGLEYMSQGLKFNGYYAANGHTYIFDQTFAYTHELRYNELQLPIGLKLAFNSDKEHAVTPYLFGGIGFRYIFGSYVVISSDSTETTPYDGKGTIGFEHELLMKGFNAFYQGGLGIQKNFRATKRGIFCEVTFKRGFSRIHYSGYHNSNNINFRDNNLAITFGLRF